MKEVPKKDLPEISGGEFPEGGCVPVPPNPLGPDGPYYPQFPVGPVVIDSTPDA